MSFETLVLRPTSGTVDVKRVSAWLDSFRTAFRDPIERNSWHLRATVRQAVISEQHCIDHPNEVQIGLRVWVVPAEVYLASLADRDDLARGLEFVRWLFEKDSWTATVDGVEIGVIDDPSRLFPSGLPDPLSLNDDPTIPPVMAGKLVTWRTESGGELRTFAIHSSDRWRYENGKCILRGRLSEDAILAWNAAVEALDLDDPELPERPDPSTSVSMDVETPEGSEWAYFDTVAPPAAYRPLVAMVTRWIDWLDRWALGTQIETMMEIEQVKSS